jgi:hypothetical protein
VRTSAGRSHFRIEDLLRLATSLPSKRRRSDQNRGSDDVDLCSTAFSASSRNFDLNGEARAARTKQRSRIIPPV